MPPLKFAFVFSLNINVFVFFTNIIKTFSYHLCWETYTLARMILTGVNKDLRQILKFHS